MLSKNESRDALQKLFQRHMVVDINDLFRSLKTSSRMSVFRRLRDLEYLSSYSHAGRYYTLLDIPQFDDNGLWFHQNRGFSKFGTLRTTIIEILNASVSGMTHSQLYHMLRVRVQDTLLSLVRAEKIGRQEIQGKYLYVGADAQRAGKQLEQYRTFVEPAKPLPMTLVIEVLVETLYAGQVKIAASLIAERLFARGLHISVDQIEQVFSKYGIDTQKKRAR
ncbi:MAG: hypothetical protein ACYSTT_22455 [Planctomycetota bacterium]|jgi:hypothetical protein